MRKPLRTEIDYEAGAAFIYYREIRDGEAFRSDRINFDVRVTYDRAGNLLGIELLGLDEAAFSVARDFASRHDLVFPSELHGAA